MPAPPQLPAHAMGYRIVSMKKGRRRYDENLTFSRTQVYLVAGSIIIIGVLAFSLGHLISRDDVQRAENAARLEIPALPEAEVLEEMKRLERRLQETDREPAVTRTTVEETGKEEKQDAAKAGTGETPGLSITEKLAPQNGGESIRVKTVEKVERVTAAPLQKDTTVRAYKPIIRTRRLKITPSVPEREDSVTVTEKVEEPMIAPVAVEPEKEETVPAVAALKIKPEPSIPANPKYTVQIGSFPSEAKAKTLVRKLKLKGYHSYIKKLVRSRSVWYRVRVGAFEKRRQAEKSLGNLKNKEGLEGIILGYEEP